jgi:chromosomal replication initiation ATPase DnaA
MASATIWDQVLSRIEDQVGKHSFSTWFKPTTLLADAGPSLSIRVPNPLFVEWLPKHYSVVLAEALRDVGRPDVKLVFRAGGLRRAKQPRPAPEHRPRRQRTEATTSAGPSALAAGS